MDDQKGVECVFVVPRECTMLCKYLLAAQMVSPATGWCDADFLPQMGPGKEEECNSCQG